MSEIDLRIIQAINVIQAYKQSGITHIKLQTIQRPMVIEQETTKDLMRFIIIWTWSHFGSFFVFLVPKKQKDT